MALLTTSFTNLLKVDNMMRIITSDRFNLLLRENEWQKIVNLVSSNRKSEDTTRVSDLGQLQLKDEGADISYSEILADDTKRITNKTYAGGVALTPEMLLFEKYGQMAKLATGLANAAAMTLEYRVANMFNYATSTTDADSVSTAGIDGLALLSTAHPLLRGGTVSNKLANWTALSYTSLQDVIDLIEATTTDSGYPQNLKCKSLIVPRKLKGKSIELLQSPYNPSSAENQVNVVKNGWNIEPIVNHFFSSQTNWYIQANEHDLTVQKVKGFEVERDIDPWNRNALYLGSLIYGFGFGEWRGMAGSAA